MKNPCLPCNIHGDERITLTSFPLMVEIELHFSLEQQNEEESSHDCSFGICGEDIVCVD